MRKLAVLFVLLILATIGLGYYRGWFNFSTKEDPKDQRVSVNVNVDVAKLKEDKELFGEEINKVKGLAKNETAKGDLTAVDDKNSSFTLATADNKELILHLDADAKLHVKGEAAGLKDLRPGDRVTATYRVKDGKNVARSVTVERGK